MKICKIDKKFKKFYNNGERWTPIREFISDMIDEGWGKDISLEEASLYVEFYTNLLENTKPFEINGVSEFDYQMLQAYKALTVKKHYLSLYLKERKNFHGY